MRRSRYTVVLLRDPSLISDSSMQESVYVAVTDGHTPKEAAIRAKTEACGDDNDDIDEKGFEVTGFKRRPINADYLTLLVVDGHPQFKTGAQLIE